MDQNKLRTVVFEKTGIKIDTTDPVFALVALNEAVLSEYLEHHMSLMNSVADRIGTQTNQLLEASERYKKLLQHIGDAAATGSAPEITTLLAAANEPAVDVPTSIFGKSNCGQWIAVASSVAVLTAALTLGGQWIFGRPENPPPKQAVQAIHAPLTTEQVLMIQNGEKYAKMWPKLDEKTQARIKALIQQP